MPNLLSKKQATTDAAQSAGIFAQGYAVAVDNFYTAVKRYGVEKAYALCVRRSEELGQQQSLDDDLPFFDEAGMQKRRPHADEAS